MPPRSREAFAAAGYTRLVRGAPEERPADSRHAWLPAVLPAVTRTFRTRDRALAAILEQAGAEPAAERPDVEIGAPAELSEDAACAVAVIEQPEPNGARRALRAAQRMGRSLETRARTKAAARALRGQGFRETDILLWEVEHEIRAPTGAPRRRRSLIERFPLCGLAVAYRSREPTLIEALHDQAGVSRGGRLLLREGTVISLTHTDVFRLAVGPSPVLAGQLRALEILRNATPPPSIATRVPWLLARGRLGLAEWSREPRLEGEPGSPGLGEKVVSECVDFLADLFALLPDGNGPSPASDAETIAAARPNLGGTVRALGRRLEARIVRQPRGFGHGDFHHRNLLVSGGRLTGVIDWDVAGPGRLPLLDFLHLRATAEQASRRGHLGPVIVEHMIPWARGGGDEAARALAGRVGIEVEPGLLSVLVAAYWFDFLARDLRKWANRAEREPWLKENIDRVIPALGESIA
jgi:hypothetical protein